MGLGSLMADSVSIEKSDFLSAQEVRQSLKTLKVAREIHTFGQVTSTNDLAYEMALRGTREGVVVVAESQTHGRGRLNRSWISPPGKNLYLSLILRPQVPARCVPVMTYLGAISTAEALVKNFSLKIQIKWPNDILVRRRKLAGLLNEAKVETDRVHFVVLGFGVNLNMGEGAFPKELREKATSVMREVGHEVSRVSFTRYLLESIENWYETFLLQGPDPIIETWETLARIRGKVLEVRSFGGLYRGQAQGLDRDGTLILCNGQGETIKIAVGDVTESSRG
jgi:BirA family biotin operon repressor/biotin-[acetyl-CoA-carboxylase] ligase